jgi:hypothetical protein
LNVIDARNIPRLDDTRKTEMLEAFAEGYFQALAELAGRPRPDGDDDRRGDTPRPNPDQPGLFD